MSMTLAQKLHSISPSVAAGGGFAGLSTDNVLTMFSKLLEPQKVAILQLHYPAVDVRNHKSLHAVVAALNSHGMSEAAQLADEEVPYIVTDDLKKALQVCHEIQNDSVAIGVTLRYGGAAGAEAEALIRAELQRAAVPHTSGLHSAASALAHAA